MNNLFLKYLKTGILGVYKVGSVFEELTTAVFENKTSMGFENYLVNNFYYVSVDEETRKIFMIGIYVWDKAFIAFMKKQLACTKITFKKVLDYLDQHSLEWQVFSTFSFDKQLSVKLLSGVVFIFSIDKKNEMVLQKIDTLGI
jgi:hypothetical protein